MFKRPDRGVPDQGLVYMLGGTLVLDQAQNEMNKCRGRRAIFKFGRHIYVHVIRCASYLESIKKSGPELGRKVNPRSKQIKTHCFFFFTFWKRFGPKSTLKTEQIRKERRKRFWSNKKYHQKYINPNHHKMEFESILFQKKRFFLRCLYSSMQITKFRRISGEITISCSTILIIAIPRHG